MTFLALEVFMFFCFLGFVATSRTCSYVLGWVACRVVIGF